MPLALTRRAGSDVWYISGSIEGTRIRESTGYAEKSKARQILAAREKGILERLAKGDRAVATWSEAVASYEGVVEPGPNTVALLERLTGHLKDTRLAAFDQRTVDRACAVLLRPDAAPATKLRNVITPMVAVLNHAARRGLCDVPRFEKPRGATGVKRTRWLTPEEFGQLRDAAAPHLRPLLTFLVGTGTRLSEALELEWSAVDLEHGRAKVWQKQGNERTLELPPAAVAALRELPHREGAVFRTHRGEPYADNGRTFGGQIAGGFEAACRRAELADVTPHILRHTWASWSYAADRDVMALRDRGGWSTVAQVERYAKLCPRTMLPAILAVWNGHTSDTALPVRLVAA